MTMSGGILDYALTLSEDTSWNSIETRYGNSINRDEKA